MTTKEYKKAVAKFNGWVEGDVARFPTPHLLAQFLKYLEDK